MKEYKIERFEAYIEIDELMENYFDYEITHAKCRECPGYRGTWACPELDFDPAEFVSGFRRLRLIVDRVDNSGTASPKEAQNRLFGLIRDFDRNMRELESLLPGACALAAQECMECDPCLRTRGLPCIHPDRKRYGPEAIGILASKLVPEKLGFSILWSDGQSIPEYYLLVGGILEK